MDDAAVKFKIAIASRDAIGTGGGTVALSTARSMAAKGHMVAFVSDYPVAAALPGVDNIAMPCGQELHDWRPKSRPAAILRHFIQLFSFSVFGHCQLRRLKRLGYVCIDHNLEAFGADIVVLHNVFMAQFIAEKRSNLRKAFQFVNPVFSFRLIREKIVLRSRHLSVVVAVAPQLLQEADSYIKKGAMRQTIPNGIDLVRFSPISPPERDSLRRELEAGERFVVLFVGHEYERKRLDLVMQAVAKVTKPVALWVIGGRGSSRQEYEQLARSLGISDNTRFWGTRSDTERFFRAADCFVLPSDYEAWPLVVLEAMACGTPTIMTPTGCAPYVIRNRETGFVVQNQEEIASALSCLIDNNDLRIRIKINSRLEAEKYGWDSVTKKYLDIFCAIKINSEAT